MSVGSPPAGAPTPELAAAEARLRREAGLLTRYLLDRDCPPELVERYVRGHHARLGHLARAERSSFVSFAFENPWSIPYLDAAGGFIDGGGALRAKLLLMAAVLEAAPNFVDAFLPRHVSRALTLATVAWLGLRAVASVLIGVPLALVVRRTDQ